MAVLVLALAGTGCRTGLAWVAMPFLYDEVELPESQVLRDLPYRNGADADARKHRLDLFLPEDAGARWPLVVFVHGGGWTSGDKDLTVGGADVYGNIGRFLARRGMGAAVMSYRLQPQVEWQAQVSDVADAVAWVHAHAEHFGGDPDAIFLMGHSAGAQLAAHVALDPGRGPLLGVCGLIPVSGAAYDLSDAETYALGASPRYYERRFRNGGPDPGWQRRASPIRFIAAGGLPALVLYAEDDWPALQHQARLLAAALEDARAPTRLVEIPDADHYTVVLALSRTGDPASESILDFVRDTPCRGARRIAARSFLP